MQRRRKNNTKPGSVYFEEGAIARQDAKSRAYNPYPSTSSFYRNWNKGWDYMDKKIEEALEDISSGYYSRA